MQEKLNNSWKMVLQQVELLKEDHTYIQGLSRSGIALFGAGSVGLDALKYFQSKNYPVHCFIDNSVPKQGTELNGIPVVSGEHHLAKSASMVIITSKTAVSEICVQLKTLKLKCMSFDAYFVLDNLKRFAWVRNEILADNDSVLSLDGILLSMLANSSKYCAEIMEPNQYFCLPHFLSTNDCFVDAGAYVGDTAERFIWTNTGMFQHMYLFEPGAQQLSALRCRMNRLIFEWALDPSRISIINAGLADQNGSASFSSNYIKPAASMFSDNNDIEMGSSVLQKVPTYSLDAYLKEHHSPVTFIKADIEGMEVSMLNGASITIRRNKPKLALSAYHRIGDLFEIIDTVRRFVPEYQIALRHHSPNLAETVLYCWVDSAP